MTENNTQERKDPQAEDTALNTSDSPLDVLSSIIKPQTRKECILPVLICIITLVHFLVFPQLDSFWINMIRLFLSILTILYIRNIAHKAYNKRLDIIKSFNNNQPQFFTIIVVLGGTLAILIPMIMNVTKLIGDGAPLTTALLGITGGVIAIFGYYKTHQKSELEREQLDTQKKKDQQDYDRQVHAERRSRYTKAVEQLADNKAAVRLGGVYTLTSLVDEWLDDDNDDNMDRETRFKEGQVIINNLCSYIRSPFELAESYYIFDKENLTECDLEKYGRDKFFKDKPEFHGEKHVRQAILHEIKSRLNSGNAQDKEGAWSNFIYDFSNSHIFYTFDLSNGFLSADSNFSNINFLCDAKFNSTTFKNIADFSNTVFHGSAEFSNTIFEDIARFQKAEFKESDTFKNIADFSNTVFHGSAEFSNTIFEYIAYFWKAEFKESATFEGAQFKSLQGILTSGMQSSDSQYLQFKSSADFRQAIFGKIAKFGRAKFYGSADFRETWFQTRSPFFHILGTLKIYAEFSQNSDPHNYIFDKLHDKSCLIDTKTKTHEIKLKWGEGEYLPIKKRFNIPTGCNLFKP